jgi:hypothetical protein
MEAATFPVESAGCTEGRSESQLQNENVKLKLRSHLAGNTKIILASDTKCILIRLRQTYKDVRP